MMKMFRLYRIGQREHLPPPCDTPIGVGVAPVVVDKLKFPGRGGEAGDPLQGVEVPVAYGHRRITVVATGSLVEVAQFRLPLRRGRRLRCADDGASMSVPLVVPGHGGPLIDPADAYFPCLFSMLIFH